VRALLLSLMLVCAVSMGASPVKSVKAVPLKVEGDTVTVVKSFPITITAATGAGYYSWRVPVGVVYEESFNTLTVKSAPKGSHRITVDAISAKIGPDKVTVEFTVDRGETTLNVGDVPVPPVPPGPTPPTPVPPTPVGDLKVLITYESEELPKLPLEELRIYRGVKVREALKAKCGADTSTDDGKGYWIIDKDADVSKLPKFWQDAFKRPRTSPFYLHMFRGDTPVYEAAMPKTEKEVIDLINSK
jgi:hypothetical protein